MEKCIFANNELAFKMNNNRQNGTEKTVEMGWVISFISSGRDRTARWTPGWRALSHLQHWGWLHFLHTWPVLHWPCNDIKLMTRARPPSLPHSTGLTQRLQLNLPLLCPHPGVEPGDLFPFQNNGAPRVPDRTQAGRDDDKSASYSPSDAMKVTDLIRAASVWCH